MFTGYSAEPELTKRAFYDAWFKTGDFGYVDNEGYLHLMGRHKDLINKGGMKINPDEIDKILLQHYVVKDAIIVAFEDEIYGEEIYSFAVLFSATKDIKENDLITYCLKHLGALKCPRRIIFVKNIPRNGVGKVDKKQLLALLR